MCCFFRYGPRTSMPRAGFEIMIPVPEQFKTIRALDRAATGVGQ
jgi:hypothetical protein